MFNRAVAFALAGTLAAACGSAGPIAVPFETSGPGSSTASALFLETDATRTFPSAPHIVRWRLVKLNLALLMDEAGRARRLEEVSLNLFPDLSYTGSIDEIETNAGSLAWVGRLKGVLLSHFSMVYTSGVFAGHFASPLGIYEVSFVEPGLYRVIMIDQSKLPQD